MLSIGLTRKNRLGHHAHISEGKFRVLLRAFAVDLTATQIAVLTGLKRNTINRYLTKIRCPPRNEGDPVSEPGTLAMVLTGLGKDCWRARIRTTYRKQTFEVEGE